MAVEPLNMEGGAAFALDEFRFDTPYVADQLIR